MVHGKTSGRKGRGAPAEPTNAGGSFLPRRLGCRCLPPWSALAPREPSFAFSIKLSAFHSSCTYRCDCLVLYIPHRCDCPDPYHTQCKLSSAVCKYISHLHSPAICFSLTTIPHLDKDLFPRLTTPPAQSSSPTPKPAPPSASPRPSLPPGVASPRPVQLPSKTGATQGSPAPRATKDRPSPASSPQETRHPRSETRILPRLRRCDAVPCRLHRAVGASLSGLPSRPRPSGLSLPLPAPVPCRCERARARPATGAWESANGTLRSRWGPSGQLWRAALLHGRS